MTLPVQAAPVSRGPTRAYQQVSVTQQQACNIGSCIGDLIRCAMSCFPNPLNPGCITCLGPAWNDCKGCLGIH